MASQLFHDLNQFQVYLVILMILCINQVISDTNKYFHISTLCSQRITGLNKKIDGAVITSKSEDNLDCIITFQTDTIRQKFMLRFEKLSLDCDDHLYIFDGAHAWGNHKIDLSCRSTKSEVGTIFTQGSFVTLKYQTGPVSKTLDNGFKLIITAYKEHALNCKDFKCFNTFCISRDLICDKINHCGDNSDESSQCEVDSPSTPWWSLPGPNGTLTLISLTISAFIICFICVITISYYLCRRQPQFIHHQQQQRFIIQNSTTPVLAHPTSYHLTKQL